MEAAAGGDFDLIFMDVELPDTDGPTAAKAIRHAEAGGGRRVPIVAVTAHAPEGYRDRCIEAGMEDCVTWPSDPARLAEVMARALRGATADPADVYDRRVALVHVGDDPGILEELLGMFLEQAPERMGRLEAALAAGDSGVLEREAHSLKGTAATLGMSRLQGRAREVERLGREGVSHLAMEAVEELRSALEEVIGRLAGKGGAP